MFLSNVSTGRADGSKIFSYQSAVLQKIRRLLRGFRNILWGIAEALLGPRQTSKIESFAVIINGFQPVTIVTKVSI